VRETTKERLARKIIYYQTQNRSLTEDVERLKSIVEFNENRKKELNDVLDQSNRLLSALRN
jgi:broad-specificity NMP kinase